MIFRELPLGGAYLIDLEPIHDSRGYNARAWCEREFARQGLETVIAQVNLIANGPAGTLRGFHYQVPPMGETKLFRVTHGALFDVIIDLRPESKTYLEWTSVTLRADEPTLLYVPRGFAQGFQTIEDDTQLTYQVSQFYSPDHGAGMRYDDPKFGIPWPLPVTQISEQDLRWPDFKESEC